MEFNSGFKGLNISKILVEITLHHNKPFSYLGFVN